MAVDPYIEGLRQARDAGVVIKTDFLAFVSGCPTDGKIFAFEGVADKRVFYYWIKSVDPSICYEPYVCGSKQQVLKLFDALVDDVSGLARRVFYFVDRDFDDLQGRPECESIYITDGYSIENHLVSAAALNELLIFDLQCSGASEVRREVIRMFNSAYKAFLECVRDLNFRIYAAKRINIQRTEELSNRLDGVVEIGIFTVERKECDLAQLVKLQREASEAELAPLRSEFEKLDPAMRYRGKYCWVFFCKWLSLLSTDRQSPNSQYFADCPASAKGALGGFSLEGVAARSRPPGSLPEFLQSLGRRCALNGRD